jgi:triacylglycerol lipase
MDDAGTSHRRPRTWLRAAVLVALLTGWLVPPASASASASAAGAAAAGARTGSPTDHPVLLVHGIFGSGAVWSVEDPWATPQKVSFVRWLSAAGYRVYTVDLPGGYNRRNARVIRTRVNEILAETGARKVHLVGHSLGGLSSRYYAKFLGNRKVASYTAFGTGQHGWQPVCGLPPDLAGELCPSSTFLAKLNAGDDTPGAFRYTSIRSTTLVNGEPADQSEHTLDGGACMVDVDGGTHGNESNSPVILTTLLQVLRGECPGEFRDLPITG